MDIHKPKPWHGLREFLKEYLIIVIGVLTALGAEQLVAWLHGRGQAQEAREAVRTEIAANLGALEWRRSEGACIDRRLKEIAAVLKVTESRVCQLHSQILKNLRRQLQSDEQLFSFVA